MRNFGSAESKRMPLARLAACTLAVMPLAAHAAQSAAPADDSPESVREEIAAMRQRLAELEAKQQRLDEQKEQAATAAAVQADAGTRGLGLSTGSLSAGYEDGRFILQNEDGSITFRPWLHLQIRNATSIREGSRETGNADWENGFEIRRARFGFDGNFGPNVLYALDFASYGGSAIGSQGDGVTTSTTGGRDFDVGSPVLEEGWLLYHFADTPWSVRAGQFHDPLSHEAMIGAKNRGIEASLQTDIFANTDTFTQGITAIYDPKTDWRFEAGLTDGIRSANTNFEDYPSAANGFDWGVAGRAEYKCFGNWKDYRQFTALGVKQDLVVLGAGLDFSQRGSTDSFAHTIDAQLATANGWFMYAAYFGRFTGGNDGIFLGAPTSTSVADGGGTGNDTYEYSLLAQVGRMVTKKFEPYVRYEYLELAGTPGGGSNSVNEFSVGANYYLVDQNLKLSAQAMYLPTGIPINDESNDVLINSNSEEFVLMGQVQLAL